MNLYESYEQFIDKTYNLFAVIILTIFRLNFTMRLHQQLLNARKIKFSLVLILLTATTFNLKAQTCTKPFHIVVLGSSTAYGDGASIGHSWVALYTSYLKKINKNYVVDNIAVPGTTTYSAQPDNYVPPKGRPAPLIGHNITTAIQLNADAIIINFPTNDVASDFTLTEQQNNFKRITTIAKNHNILVWVATTQPRDNFSAQQVSSQKKLFTWIQSFYKGHSIDFQNGLASDKDSILFKYNAGDGIHLNDAGHKVLYQRVVAKSIPDSLCNSVNKVMFFDQKKIDSIHSDLIKTEKKFQPYAAQE